MYAALWIPEFPLQALVRPHSARWGKPLAVLEDSLPVSSSAKAGRKGKAPIIALNEAARRLGVLKGMTATQGQARCAELTLFARDREAEMIAQETLLEIAGNFSPDYEDTAPGCCVVDLFGRSALRGREETVGAQMREALRDACGLEAQAGLATTPDLALLAAQMAGGREGRKVKVLPAEGQALFEALAREPIDYLDPPPALREILRGWGIHHIGSFLDLPRAEVSCRLGKEAAFLWDKVSGTRRRLLHLVRVPADYRQSYLFDYEVEQLEPVLFVLRRLLEMLIARLGSVYLAADQIELVFVFADRRESTEVLRIPDPTADVDLLFRILHTRLEHFVVDSPIASLTLTLQPARPLKRQFDLFESVLRDPNRFGQTLARLEALLGRDRVGSPQALDSHRPDALIMRSFEEVLEEARARQQKRNSKPGARVKETAGVTGEDEEAAKTLVSSAVLLGMPLRRFRPPVAIRVETARTREGYAAPVSIEGGPCRAHVRQWQGPWKSSGDWWEPERSWKREEWDVQLSDGRLYRLARETTGWLLEGEYG